MKSYIRDAFKVSVTSLITTIIVFLLLIGFVSSSIQPGVLYTGIKYFIAVALPFLVLNPIFGFFYSFFIKSKSKIAFIILHLACICTISVFAFFVFMFRYFVSFAP